MAEMQKQEIDEWVTSIVGQLVGELPHFVGVTDSVGQFTWINEAGLALLGRSGEETEPLTTGDILGDEVFDRYYTEIRPMLLAGDTWRGRLDVRVPGNRSIPVDAAVIAGRGPGGEIQWLALCAIDVTDQVTREAELEHQASHDPLTGLPNRALLRDRLDLALAVARRTRSPIAVIALDVDGFKRVNDEHGHAAGDQLLQQITERLRAAVRPADTVARLGGDEFVVVIYPPENNRVSVRVARRIHSQLAVPFRLDAATVRATASIGVALGRPGLPIDPNVLLAAADRGLYRAKDRGGNRIEVVDPHESDDSTSPGSGTPTISRALAMGAIRARFAPVLDLSSGSITRVVIEPLWDHATLGIIGGDDLRSTADASGYEDLIAWAAIRDGLAAARDAAIPDSSTVTLPLCRAQLNDPDLGNRLAELRSAFAELRLDLAVSEHAFEGMLAEDASAQLRRLHNLGFTITLTDHGEGSLPLSVLALSPIDTVELAFSSADGRRTQPKTVALSARIGPMIGADVIAARVADPADLPFLAVLGITGVRGPAAGFDVEGDELGTMLQTTRRVAGERQSLTQPKP